MKSLLRMLLLVALAGVIGCGGGNPPLNTRPLTKEELEEIRKKDEQTDEDESTSGGTLKDTRKKKKN